MEGIALLRWVAPQAQLMRCNSRAVPEILLDAQSAVAPTNQPSDEQAAALLLAQEEFRGYSLVELIRTNLLWPEL